VHQSVKDRQQKGHGLPAAGLRAGEQIAAVERRRNRIGLDRGGPLKSKVLNAAEEIRMELEVSERHCVYSIGKNQEGEIRGQSLEIPLNSNTYRWCRTCLFLVSFQLPAPSYQ
jgi:hypothetical protein